MAYVVCEPCVKCKHTDCVEVCPVDCFRELDEYLVIDPIECIDCNACVPVCPEEAIFPEDDVPEQWTGWVQRNADEAAEAPPLTERKEPLKEM
ncbi:MAG: 4Fe-4S dicluster domain-containing protein [Verrucomicrobiota bacterium]